MSTSIVTLLFLKSVCLFLYKSLDNFGDPKLFLRCDIFQLRKRTLRKSDRYCLLFSGFVDCSENLVAFVSIKIPFSPLLSLLKSKRSDLFSSRPFILPCGYSIL